MTTEIFTGSCHCGAVRYEARGIPSRVSNCHCVDCRRISGAPFMTWAAYERKNVSFTKGSPIHVDSSDTAERDHCGDCGSPLVWASKANPNVLTLSVCTMDEPDRFKPEFHIFVRSKVSWLHLDDELPKYETWRK